MTVILRTGNVRRAEAVPSVPKRPAARGSGILVEALRQSVGKSWWAMQGVGPEHAQRIPLKASRTARQLPNTGVTQAQRVAENRNISG